MTHTPPQERWQEIACELGTAEMRDSWSGAVMERCKPGDYIGDWLEAESACKRIAGLEAERDAALRILGDALGKLRTLEGCALPLVAWHESIKAERDEAHEHRRRLFEALEELLCGRGEDVAIALLDELRPHVAKEHE